MAARLRKMNLGMHITAKKKDFLLHSLGIGVQDLLHDLVEVAQSFSISPISSFRVGAAAIGSSGNIYLGTNLEFLGSPIQNSVHAEHFLVCNAFLHGEQGLEHLAVSAAPCGHCRQILNECSGAGGLMVHFNDQSLSLSDLLPHSFGPSDLGCQMALLDPFSNNLVLSHNHSGRPKKGAAEALSMANVSYAPHTSSYSGFSFVMRDGSIHAGPYLENCAFNPSLQPVQAAIVSTMVSQGPFKFEEVLSGVLVEADDAAVSQEASSRALFSHLFPTASFDVVSLKQP